MVTSHGSLLLRLMRPLMRPHGISHRSFLVCLQDLRMRVTAAFWTLWHLAHSSSVCAFYPVPVRQVTISLSLPLACTSRYKPWESLWGSSATTPLVDFHHRSTACPSYKKQPPGRSRTADSFVCVFVKHRICPKSRYLSQQVRWRNTASSSVSPSGRSSPRSRKTCSRKRSSALR